MTENVLPLGIARMIKKVFVGLGSLLAGAGIFLTLTAARHQETIRPNVKVGPVDVGGLLPDEAARRVRIWWESEKLKTIPVTASGLTKNLPGYRPSALGVTIDDQATVTGLPMQSFTDETKAKLTGEELPSETYPLKYKATGQRPIELIKAVREASPKAKPAKVRFEKGAIFVSKEGVAIELDEPAVAPAALEAVANGTPLALPLKTAPKQHPDEMMDRIKSVVAEFSTSFNSRQANRSSNLRLAASKIDGLILMPGEKFSFNDTVGRRTRAAGFLEAGVYLNGRSDTGIGGGICQVSTTLYNAVLFANLKIARRSNHSMPVPYVPLGRDATVDYGNLDFQFVNSSEAPIAIDSEYRPGRLTFRILGEKIPGQSVKIVQGPRTGFGRREQRIKDPSIAEGRQVIRNSGSSGIALSTYRHVFQDGQLVKKEPLGRSHYPGGIRIIAIGTRKAAPVTVPPVGGVDPSADPTFGTPGAPTAPPIGG